MVPSVAFPPETLSTAQFTAELNDPVPRTFAKHWLLASRATVEGLQEIETEVIVDGGAVTVIIAAADFVESCVEVAVIVAVPAAEAVKTPMVLTAPMFDGLTDHVTALLKLPAPITAAVQTEV